MRNIGFVPKAFEEYEYWIETDRKTALRIWRSDQRYFKKSIYWNWEA